MIAIIDYGAGNLFSVKNALDYLNIDSKITSSTTEISAADKLILPGVGAFPDAMRKLEDSGVVPILVERKKPLLGICLGMQMLFEYSEEFEKVPGLSLIPGYVDKLLVPAGSGLKIPHMGWSDVKVGKSCALSEGINTGDRFYFVHSFKAVTENENISLYTEHGQLVPGLVFRDNVYGTQFHPEKSGDIGLKILKNFAEVN